LKRVAIDADAVPATAGLLTKLSKGLIQLADSGEWEEIPLALLRPERLHDVPKTVEGLNTTRLSDVMTESMDWLWPNRIPANKLTIIGGDPDKGKTWLVLDLIARLTTGRRLPDGTFPTVYAHYPPDDLNFRFQALYASAEDGKADTIRPRLDMLRGDPSRVEALNFVLDDGKRATLDIGKHLDRLDDWLAQHPLVRLVVLDPLAAFLGRIDSHRNSDVRAVLSPVKELAEKRHVAIIGINHLNKSEGGRAMYRGIGSIGFVGAARSSWLVVPDPKRKDDRRFLLPVKGNLAPENPGGLAFQVGSKACGLLWEEGRIDLDADDSLSPSVPSDDNRAPARREAKEWLLAELKDGPKLAVDIKEKAKADLICEKTLRTAKKELGAYSDRLDRGDPRSPHIWVLPKASR